jgi:predicted DNA-binding transcriptional regulator YafY
MGDKVEILEPETLREKIKENLLASLARYEK